MIDLFTAAKYGPMAVASFNGSAEAAVRFSITKPTGSNKALFAIRATKAVRILQGDSTVTAAATTATYLAPNVHYPMVVETEEDKYFSLFGATADAGDLEVTLVSDTTTWALASA